MIIVIGCPKEKALRARCLLARTMATRKIGEKVLLLGDMTQTMKMKKYFDNAACSRRVIVDSNCKSTIDMAKISTSYIASCTSITLVTSQSHQDRAQFLFELATKKMVSVQTIDIRGVTREKERMEPQKLKETKRLYEFFQFIS